MSKMCIWDFGWIAVSSTDILVLDFSKAFDKVSHNLLTHNLIHYSVKNEVNNWIQSFLADQRQAVVVEGTCSAFTPVKSGFPQGSVFGPCLFLVFINYLPQKLSKPMRLFADNTALIRHIYSLDNFVQRQKDLDPLTEWEECCLMSFYPMKCSYLPAEPHHCLHTLCMATH